MRVLVIVHGLPPHAQGGSEIYADQHARALVAAGDDVWVFTREHDPARPEYDVRHERRDGLGITWVNNTFRDVRTFEESYRHERIAAIAEDVIDAHRPDVAHIHHLTCLSTEIVRALEVRRIPSVVTLHDYWFICHRGQLLDVAYRRCDGPGPEGCDACVQDVEVVPVPAAAVPLARAIDRLAPPVVSRAGRRMASALAPALSHGSARQRLTEMRRVCDGVTHFLCPSHSLRERFVRFGLPPERLTLSPYGLDHRPFEEQDSRSTPSTPLRLGFVGSLMASKAPHLLLEAHRRLAVNEATVTVYGEPADYHGDTSYRRVLAPLLTGPGVSVAGGRPHHDIPRALGSLDVLVVPSIWEENSPLIVWEAMLAGLPVVASRIGGIPEIVEHGRNGLLFEPGDVDDLERTLRTLVAEPGLLRAYAAGARATAVRTIEDDVRQARRLYSTLASAASTTPRRIAAIVLNHRAKDDTLLAVSALLASNSRPAEVIVVDNDVADECREPLSRHGDGVSYLHTGRNLGFAGGMNAGIRAALARGADDVLLVNADVFVPPDCIDRLQRELAAGGTGIVGPLVRSRSLPDLIGSAGIDYHPGTGRMKHRAFGARVPHGSGRSSQIVDGRRDAVSGCVMLISRAVFDRIGLFDERYFFGFEEIDLCLRARAAGFDTRLAASVTVYHEGGRSIGPDSPRRFYFAARNHLLLASTLGAHRSAWSRAALALSISALNVAHAVRARGGTLPGRLAATARGIGDHVRRRYGPDDRP
jgi:GT2 family glycosyltransferase/glycosyltransferase involved in cell wall biosynthesis